MQTYVALAAIAGSVAAQSLTPFATPSQTISAPGNIPSGCSTNYPSLFQIQAVNATSGSAKMKRQADNGELVVELINGVITSRNKATAEVASNRQFQFSTPENNGQPQPGFLYDAGFSACANGTLAHGSSAIWYECNGGARNIIADIEAYPPPQCYQIFLQIVPYGGASAPSQTVTVTGSSSVAPAKTTVTPVTRSPDGQPNPVASPTVRTSSVAVITAISDNQPQAPRPTAVLTRISDNQPQAPTPARTPYGSASPSRYTGAAVQATAGPMVAAVVGAAALALF